MVEYLNIWPHIWSFMLPSQDKLMLAETRKHLHPPPINRDYYNPSVWFHKSACYIFFRTISLWTMQTSYPKRWFQFNCRGFFVIVLVEFGLKMQCYIWNFCFSFLIGALLFLFRAENQPLKFQIKWWVVTYFLCFFWRFAHGLSFMLSSLLGHFLFFKYEWNGTLLKFSEFLWFLRNLMYCCHFEVKP